MKRPSSIKKHIYIATASLLGACALLSQVQSAFLLPCSAATERKTTGKKENNAFINSLEVIIEAEDTRTLKKALLDLSKNPKQDLRKRAYLAIGRIGDKSGTKPLLDALSSERESSLRQFIVFAIGELEDTAAIATLVNILESSHETLDVKGRAAEALGKISASKTSISNSEKSKIVNLVSKTIGSFDHSKAIADKEQFLISKSLTALLRIKDPNSMEAVAKQLKSSNAEIRWQSAYVLGRMKDGVNNYISDLHPLLIDVDPLARAYASKALGIAKDRNSLDAIINLLKDKDERVSTSAISALGSIGDAKSVPPLIELGQTLLEQYRKTDPKTGIPEQQNSLLLIASSLGALKDSKALPFLQELRSTTTKYMLCPEVEIAIAQFGNDAFFLKSDDQTIPHNWQSVAARAQGLAELKTKRAEEELLNMLSKHPDPRAESEILNGLAKVKAENLTKILLDSLTAKDVVVRSTAATLLGDNAEPETKITKDEIKTALWNAYLAANADQMNDARIAIIEAATKLKKPFNKEVLSGEFRDPDYIVRKRALELQRELDPHDASLNALHAVPVNTSHDRNYWRRMAELAASSENLTAIILTPKGKIVVELFLHESPMTVDNFATLSRHGFYDGLTFMRVVPNFVIQGGDPRNDMNGGPGYQIRCEINEHPYRTGSVGMALSGKDTGGSQFFITHSPQPHLDGAYTLFGKVRNGMEVVNQIARGDKINHIEIVVTK